MSEKSENPSEKSEMSSVEFVQDALRKRVSPPGSGANVQDRIRRAARLLGWSYSRTRDAWYADPRISIKADEVRKIEETTGVRYGRQEAEELAHLIGRADAILAEPSPRLDSAMVDALRAIVGALDRTGAGPRD